MPLKTCPDRDWSHPLRSTELSSPLTFVYFYPGLCRSSSVDAAECFRDRFGILLRGACVEDQDPVVGVDGAPADQYLERAQTDSGFRAKRDSFAR